MGILSNLAAIGRRVDRMRDNMLKLDAQLYDRCKGAFDSFEHDKLQEIAASSHKTPNDEEVRLGQTEGKIPAIKAYRIRTGAGLAEGKEVIEKHFHLYGLTFYAHPPYINSDGNIHR